MKILVVGDSFFPSEAFRLGMRALSDEHSMEFIEVTREPAFEPSTESEKRLREFEGTPAQVTSALTNHDVLVVHGAPVSDEVLRASPNLGLVCCARGGPANVDVESARSLGIRITTAPGKNAPSVADLTLGFAVMLVRGLHKAETFLRTGNRMTTNFDGAQFFGLDLVGLTLGLIGFGRVGREVCTRALAFGMEVLAYDPNVNPEEMTALGAKPATRESVVGRADIVSLHARSTSDNRHMVDGALLSEMRPGAFFINTAREALVEEKALLEALETGHLAGAALDVFEPDGAVNDALVADARVLEKLVVVPHVGGATRQTLQRGAEMVAADIERFGRGDELLYGVA